MPRGLTRSIGRLAPEGTPVELDCYHNFNALWYPAGLWRGQVMGRTGADGVGTTAMPRPAGRTRS